MGLCKGSANIMNHTVKQNNQILKVELNKASKIPVNDFQNLRRVR